MALSIPTLPRQNNIHLLPGIAKLASWRFRQMWRFLLITWLGLLAMVVLACAGPLFTQVANSAYTRSLIEGAADGPYVTVETVSTHPTQSQIQQIEQQSDAFLRQSALGSYRQGTPNLIVQTPALDLLSGGKTNPGAFIVDGYDSTQAAQHTTILQGRMPQTTTTDTLELAISSAATNTLGLHLGSTFQGRFPIALGSQVWKFIIVGIIAPKQPSDTYWAMGNPFTKSVVDLTSNYYTVVNGASSFNFLAANDALTPKVAVMQASPSQSFTNAFVLFWRFPFNLSHLNASNLDTLSQQAGSLSDQLSNKLQNNISDLTYANPFGTLLVTLRNSSAQTITVSVTVTFLLLITLALVLFLVSMLSDVLIERQAAIIATLRSRGATRFHVFGTFALQGIVLGLAALLLGPLLAILLVSGMARLLLTPDSQQSLSVLTDNPLQAMLAVKWYALIAVVVALFVMILAINRASKLDIVTLRREASRTQRASLWRRLNLDLFFAGLLLLGYSAFVYFWPSLTLTASQIDPVVFVTLTNLGFLGSPLLVVAVLLLFLRFFPGIVHLATRLVAKKRSAPAVLALAQMERTPRPAARMIVLLALAIASSCFLLTLIASKEQRNVDQAAFYAGGVDFSGQLPATHTPQTFSQLQRYYSSVQGVQSATLGYQDIVQLDFANQIQQPALSQGALTINAVNPTTYAQTARWSPVYSTQPLSDLMAQLAAHRSSGINNNVVYALVDVATWQRFHLTQGVQFTLPLDSTGTGHLNFIPLAEINYVPAVYDTAADPSHGAAIIVDYQNYLTVKATATGATQATIAPNYIWLRSQDDAASLAHIRSVLPGLIDRRAILSAMQIDPGHLGIIGVLALGVGAALILALIGMLIASWFSASNRLVNFAVVRALGMGPRSVAAFLLWEQGFIYGLAFILGIGLGIMLLIFVSPTVSSLTIMHGHAWDVPLNVPPIPVVVPYPQLLLLLGILLLICLGSLVLMARIVSRPTLAQTLRLNED